MRSSADYPFQDLTERVIGGFLDLHATLGYGFLEPVYRRGLVVELMYRGLSVAQEVPFEIIHRGCSIGTYRADVIVEGKVIVEIKSGPALAPEARKQLLNYLQCAQLPLGLLLNFGPRPEVKRVIASQFLSRQ
jgi:GxxExxY protein